MRFKVHHLTGSKAGQVQEIEAQVVTVGRDPSNTIAFDPVQDERVSGFHANLTVQGDQVLLTDLGSSNGTYFNGQKLGAPMPIISGANLQFGEKGPIAVFEFPVGAPAAAPAATPPTGAPVAVAAVAAPAAAASAPPPVAAPPAAMPPPPAGAPPAAAPPPTAGAPPAAAPPPTDPIEAQKAEALAKVEAENAAAKAAADKTAAKAAKDAKPTFTKTRCAGCTLILGLLLVCVLGVAAWKSQEVMRKRFPTVTRYLRKIPVVGKFFQAGDKARAKAQKAKALKNKAGKPGREGKKIKEELVGKDE